MTELSQDMTETSNTGRTRVLIPFIHTEVNDADGSTMVRLGLNVKVEHGDGSFTNDHDRATTHNIRREAFGSFDGNSREKFLDLYLNGDEAMKELLRLNWNDRVKQSASVYFSEQQTLADVLGPHAAQSQSPLLMMTAQEGASANSIAKTIAAQIEKLQQQQTRINRAAASSSSRPVKNVRSSRTANLLDPQALKDVKWRMATDEEVAEFTRTLTATSATNPQTSAVVEADDEAAPAS